MSEHDRFQDERVSAYLDGELSGDELRQFESQLEADADLRRAVEELRALSATLGELPRSSLPADFANRVLRQAERELLAPAGAIDRAGASATDRAAAAADHVTDNAAAPNSARATSSRADRVNWRMLLWTAASIAAAAVLVHHFGRESSGPQGDPLARADNTQAPGAAAPGAPGQEGGGGGVAALQLEQEHRLATLGREFNGHPERGNLTDDRFGAALEGGAHADRAALGLNGNSNGAHRGGGIERSDMRHRSAGAFSPDQDDSVVPQLAPPGADAPNGGQDRALPRGRRQTEGHLTNRPQPEAAELSAAPAGELLVIVVEVLPDAARELTFYELLAEQGIALAQDGANLDPKAEPDGAADKMHERLAIERAAQATTAAGIELVEVSASPQQIESLLEAVHGRPERFARVAIAEPVAQKNERRERGLRLNQRFADADGPADLALPVDRPDSNRADEKVEPNHDTQLDLGLAEKPALVDQSNGSGLAGEPGTAPRARPASEPTPQPASRAVPRRLLEAEAHEVQPSDHPTAADDAFDPAVPPMQIQPPAVARRFEFRAPGEREQREEVARDLSRGAVASPPSAPSIADHLSDPRQAQLQDSFNQPAERAAAGASGRPSEPTTQPVEPRPVRVLFLLRIVEP